MRLCIHHSTIAALLVASAAVIAQTSTGTGTDTGAVGTRATPAATRMQAPAALPPPATLSPPAVTPTPPVTPPPSGSPAVGGAMNEPTPTLQGGAPVDNITTCTGLVSALARQECLRQQASMAGAGDRPAAAGALDASINADLSPGSNSPGSRDMSPGATRPGSRDISPGASRPGVPATVLPNATGAVPAPVAR